MATMLPVFGSILGCAVKVWLFIAPSQVWNASLSMVAGSMIRLGLSSFIAQSLPPKIQALVLAVERMRPLTLGSSVSGLR
jgi:hypothetical protein